MDATFTVPSLSVNMTSDVATQSDTPKMRSVHVSVRTAGKVKGNSIINLLSIGAKTYLQQHSVEVQCNLLHAPPLQRLSKESDLLDESFTETDTNWDASSCRSQESSTTQ